MNTHSKYTQQLDPVTFLGLEHLKEGEKRSLRPRLIQNISEYLLIRLLDLLPKTVDKDVEFDKISSIKDLERILEKYIPDLKNKINEILLDFKKEYWKYLP